jgi:predicted RNase H-related nuclease YkuK (DUF458 family)
MIGTFTFKKFTCEKLENVEQYVKDYCREHGNIEVMVGTDSQGRGAKTVFSTIVAMYDKGDGGHGHGAHCIFCRWNTKRYKKSEVYDRMIAETKASLEVAQSLRDAGIKVSRIDLDINPKKGEGSNVAYEAAKGWVESEGFKWSCRTFGPLITTLADWVVKS